MVAYSADDSVRFIWSQDYGKSPLHDVMLELNAEPFVNAGLDVSNFLSNMQSMMGCLWWAPNWEQRKGKRNFYSIILL